MSPMTLTLPFLVPEGGWDIDDVPDVEFRYELIDGAMLVMPPEAPRNGRVTARLHLALAPLLDERWDVLLGNGVYFDRRNYREPDLFVCRREAVDIGRVRPSDVLLAVEVMSPSSVANDRVAKPTQYAAAGIPHYWRFESDPRLLATYALHGKVYLETHRFDDVVAVIEPVGLELRLGALFD